MTSPLGPFVGPVHVRRAVLATLARWAPFYVGEAVRQSGYDDLPGFTDFKNEPLQAPVTITEAPRYVVAVPGTLGSPERRGNGMYRATWDVRVELWMWGGNYQECEDKLSFYAIAVRELMLQQASLGGLAESVVWRAERYAQVAAPTAFRTWGQAVVQFGVSVAEVVNAYAGPATPPDDPTALPPPDPIATSASVTVKPMSQPHS